MAEEGFTTKDVPTKKRTLVIRDNDVQDFIDAVVSEKGWNKSDVVNRAIWWYAKKHAEGELDDEKFYEDNDDMDSLYENEEESQGSIVERMF